jgi:hypothetical protein
VTEPTTAPAPATDGGPRDDDFTLTDWPPPQPAERDTAPLTLGYPADSTPTEPLPRRVGGESPWSAPPRGQPRAEDTTETR